MAIKIGRRAMLRGIGGAAVALPALEIMSGTRAHAAPGDIPNRYLVIVCGSSLGSGRVSIDETYVPDIEGPGYDLKTALAPLAGGMLPSGAAYADVRDEVSVITELRIPWAAMNSGRVPTAGRPDNHHETMVSPLLAGVRTPEGQTSTCFGPTSDQVVADALAGDTLFHSLQYCVQVSSYLGGGGIGGRAMISYRDGGGIGVEGERVRPQTSPRAAWEELFYGFAGRAEDPAEVARRDLERRVRASIVDVVREQADRLQRRLGSADALRLEQHFAEIRDLERRIDALGPEVTGSCMALDDPGSDPEFGGNRAEVGDEYPYDINNGYSNEDLRAEIFMGIVRMAFACDLTRSVALQMSHFHSWMNMYELTGRTSDLHELGHSGEHGTRGQAEALAWHYKHFAALVDGLRNTPDVDGTRLLDHSAIVVTHEGGYGLDPSDGAEQRSHSTERMACLMAGRAGGLVQGQHVRKPSWHPAQVLVTAMNAVGVPGGLGEVEGAIPELLP